MQLMGKNFWFNNLLLINFVNLTARDREIVRIWRNNSNLTRWFYSDHVITKEEHGNFINGMKKNVKNNYWLVKRKDKTYVGVISLNRIDLNNKNAYLGIYKNPTSKMPGEGKLLLESLIKIAFDIVGLHTLKLEVIETNTAAIKFYTKAGFSKEGKLKKFVLKDNKWHDVVIMGIFAQGSVYGV